LEELIQNSLVHLDLLHPAAIRLLIFDNRIEIVNSGSLYGGINVSDLMLGVSKQRNPAMAALSGRTMIYRGLGSGILRALKENVKIDFDNEESANQFKATVWKCDTVNPENVAVNSQNDTVNFKNVAVNSENVTVNQENVAVNSEYVAVNSENVAVNPENDTVNSENGLVNDDIGLVNSQNGPVNDDIGLVNSQNGPVNDEIGLVNSQNGPVKDEFGLVNLQNGTLLTERQKTILEIIFKDDNVTLNSMANVLSLGTTTIKRELQTLKNFGLLKRVGSDKTGHWEIITKNS